MEWNWIQRYNAEWFMYNWEWLDNNSTGFYSIKQGAD